MKIHTCILARGIYIENEIDIVLSEKFGQTRKFVSELSHLHLLQGIDVRIGITFASLYDSVRERQPGVSYLSTIPFGSVNPKFRIFLRFRSGATTRSLVLHFSRLRSGASTRSLVSFYDSVREHQPGVSYLSTIPFRSIDPESRSFLRFRSGASTRSLVSFYDSVREHPPGVSYLLTIPFGSIHPESCIFLRFRSGVSTRSLVFFLRLHSRNVTIFRIKVLEENSKKKRKKKEGFVCSSFGQNVRLLSLPYS